LKAKNEGAPLINEKIRFDKLQVISQEGKNLGVLSRDEALRKARQAELDLVLLAESGNEGYPVVKIMDFGKALYAKKKQQAEAKKHQKMIQVKELKLRPKIGEHDYQTKINQAIEFLKEGKHLKITLMFRGRETASRDERGEEMFNKINASFEDVGLTKLVQEKDSKAPQFWSRIYYLKK
jgi:translation initiation factor IF-3